MHKIVITRDNYQNLPELMKGYSQVQLIYPEPEKGREGEFWKNIPGVWEAVGHIDEAVRFARANNIEIVPNNQPYDYAKPNGFSTDFSGIRPIFTTKDCNPKCSVIILTNNRKKYILKVLKSFRRGDFEVVIVDDASDDMTLESVRANEYPFRIVYLYWPRKKKFEPGSPTNRAGPARNLGAKYAHGDLLIFMDSDIVPGPDFISEHMKSTKKQNVTVGPSMRERENLDVRDRHFMLCDDDISRLPVPWTMLNSGNFSIMKKDFEAVGGFDNDFVHWGMEDDELGYRLIKQGYKIVLNRKAYGTHLWHPPEYPNDKIKEKGHIYNSTVFYKKHLDKSIFDVNLNNKLPKTEFQAVVLSDQCNNNCIYCGFFGMRKMLSSRSELAAMRQKADRIIITGAEPTLSKDFWKTLDSLRGKEIEIVTNGRAFSYPSFARKAVQMGVRNYLIKIYGPDEKIHEQATQTKGSFDQTMKGIENLVKLNARVAAHIIVNSKNYMFFDKMISIFKKKGVCGFHVTVIPPDEDPLGSYPKNEFYSLVKRLLATDYKLRNDFFRCLQAEAMTLDDTMAMKRCLHCCFIEKCRGKPEKIANIVHEVMIRDDDVAELTPRLRQFLDIMIENNLPVNLQVIPGHVTQETAEYLLDIKRKHPHLIGINQHGWKHLRHGREYEFGRKRSYQQQYDDIKMGMERMLELFGDSFDMIFSPPFNAYDANTIRALNALGFQAITAGTKESRMISLAANLDFISDYEKQEFNTLDNINKQFSILRDPHILLHHEYFDDFSILEEFVKAHDLKSDLYSHRLNGKILLLQPRFHQPSALVCEPTGLLSLAAYLEKRYHVRILDQNISELPIEKIIEIVSNYDYVGLTAVTPQILDAYAISSAIKERYPEKVVFFGGVHPTLLPDEAIKKGSADYVIIGEGEQTALELIDALEKKKDVQIAGLYTAQGYTKNRDFLCDLDDLPYPAYHLVPIGIYRTSECMIPGTCKKAVHIMTSRGCPNNCSYCASARLYNRRVRYRSVEDVKKELEYIKTLGISWVHFHDDNFLLDKKRVLELCEKIKDMGLSWTCLANVGTVTDHPEILSAMKRAGCIGVEIGVETGDEKVFQYLYKKQNLKIIRDAVGQLRRAGIPVMFLMMSYNIGEKLDTPYKSLRLIHEMASGKISSEIITESDDFYIMGHLARASPGTDFFKKADTEGLVLTKNWSDHFEENIGFIPNSMLDDIPKTIKTSDAFTVIRKHEKLIRFCIDNCFYTSSFIIDKKFKSLDDLYMFMVDIYKKCDGPTVRQIINGDEKAGISALALLSIIRLVRSSCR